ncbi:MAG: cell wall-binding repeat-containing protein [Proteobacteria bacterium]|nr:cell wall-binding repeat-containing protein [Pseudomonadota bacterium]
MLSDRDSLPDATRTALSGLSRATLVGGEVVLSAQVQAQVDEVADRVTRVAGGDRYATAVEVVKAYGDLDTSLLGLASGETFPDALAGAS